MSAIYMPGPDLTSCMCEKRRSISKLYTVHPRFLKTDVAEPVPLNRSRNILRRGPCGMGFGMGVPVTTGRHCMSAAGEVLVSLPWCQWQYHIHVECCGVNTKLSVKWVPAM